MIKYTVRLTHSAEKDMESIYTYIAQVLQAPDTAMKQYDRIARGIEPLATFPNRCKLFDTPRERKMGLRQLLVDRYSCVYVVDESRAVVTVLRVLYSSSDVLSCLRNTES